MEKGLNTIRVVTTVTRPMRPGEQPGHPYYFVSQKQFEEMIKKNQLIEWDQHYGVYYGCTNDEFERVRQTGKIILWKTDARGALTIKKKFPQAATIYIKPPSLAATIARLKKRKKDSEQVIQQRIKDIKNYLKPENDKKFEYVIVNEEGKLAETVDKAEKIIRKTLNDK